ncbi:uncharacterized protein (TIGR02145 family) [Parabacteroides sp. PF5-5]|uniref:FISUMP domain-containing protein n=1 Tax=unclassified Parabacteroides TaxID=2649774 RepID=UPI002473D372|nr:MULTISPECIES: FISUMP domain-containing protein [unclassified Parabacteroides]MDH6304581.1 uncharacterized protein (TIGR02145 family) [Parabacteroides sp. PH5-39]MDH6315806.1 uncharacterized protein (TIGR02145 family) [Parabacteroides sp. PF5-13]MDH6319465.1 uncharacterized protein (TIGR02145 family) [Parabacteroides sp. PH5-13]MDH6323196.1 uncharacterized protein (TIGR02145 family) [Parabacteroides sp. PH5-8]MDH6326998.1 uncharacterized protein (TIGR02145 family) [Parabacteroides sp. PH5-41
MREWNVFLCIVLCSLLFMMPGCSSDETVFSSSPEQEGEGIVTFTLPFTQKGAVSYAIAGESENELSDLSIYMFNNDTKTLDQVFRTSKSEIALEGSGANQTAKINVTGKTGTKIFYFVGNGEGRSDDLAKLNAGATKESDFIEAITDKHADPLATPLLMSGKTTITEIATPGNVPLELEVKLFRRVVRLDIDNDPKESNFDVKKILVSNAKLRGYIFGNATSSPAKTIEEANYEPIEISTKTPLPPERLDSVFYLYPTTIGAGKTEIALEGIFNGETKVYNLNIADLQTVANKRYIIKIKKVELNKIDAAITVVEWEEGGEQTANPETDLVTFSAIDHSAVPGIVWTGDETYDLTGVTAAGKLTFTTTSFNEKGTIAEVKYNHGNASTYSDLKINTPTPVLTYSSASYQQEYEIDIPNINGSKVPVEMEITLRNGANPDQKKIITLYVNRYADTKLYPVMVGGLYWAPINVGATEIGTTTDVKHHGLLYQWGRSYIGFIYESGINPTDTITGPMSATDAMSGKGKGKFITGAAATNYDWLTPKNNNLWNGTNAQGPCPQGWHVPTKAEFEGIFELFKNNKFEDSPRLSLVNGGLEVKGDNGTDILYLPTVGVRSSNGLSINQGVDGVYWSSDHEGVLTVRFHFLSSGMNLAGNYHTMAYPVRCVQD